MPGKAQICEGLGGLVRGRDPWLLLAGGIILQVPSVNSDRGEEPSAGGPEPLESAGWNGGAGREWALPLKGCPHLHPRSGGTSQT